ncbi:hypothetical protein HAX54_013155, partial [Datura stramonium]|nr:hypothetical protein [Datura stramonium]
LGKTTEDEGECVLIFAFSCGTRAPVKAVDMPPSSPGLLYNLKVGGQEVVYIRVELSIRYTNPVWATINTRLRGKSHFSKKRLFTPLDLFSSSKECKKEAMLPVSKWQRKVEFVDPQKRGSGGDS